MIIQTKFAGQSIANIQIPVHVRPTLGGINHSTATCAWTTKRELDDFLKAAHNKTSDAIVSAEVPVEVYLDSDDGIPYRHHDLLTRIIPPSYA